MENKTIKVILDNIGQKNLLVFKLPNGDVNVNLESDDSDSIKKVFLKIIEEIEKNPVNLELKIGDNFEMSESKLFYDASKEYIDKLNEEIQKLELDENLIDIRNNQ